MRTQTRLERFERRTEWPLAAVAIAFLGLYSVQVLMQPRGETARALDVALLGLYFVFVIDYVARLYLAKPRVKWFFKHLLDLALVVLPFMRPLRLLSLAVVIDVLQRAGHRVHGLRRRGAGLCRVARHPSGRARPAGSKITRFGDAVWWAITTVTTVDTATSLR
jgi:voltage-gated potassium channel